jgi:hypothetical protein
MDLKAEQALTCNMELETGQIHHTYSLEQHRVRDYLYNNNLITFIVVVLAIITAGFWFEFFRQIIHNLTGDTPSWVTSLFVAILWTFIFILITIIIFNLPVAASFTL